MNATYGVGHERVSSFLAYFPYFENIKEKANEIILSSVSLNFFFVFCSVSVKEKRKQTISSSQNYLFHSIMSVLRGLRLCKVDI
jgi:hypothetical protein